MASKLAVAGTICPPLADKRPHGVELLDAVVSFTHHVDLARVRNRNAPWTVEVAVAAAEAAPSIKKRDLG